MKTIKTKQVLVNFEGKPLKNGGEDLTIGYAVSTVLGGDVSNPTLGWVLGKKFATEKDVELKAEDIVFLKKEIELSKTWLAIVKGQILEILDGKDSSKSY